jgi:hypothetical protein
MNSTKSQAEIVARRAELLVELFLQDIGATFVSDPRTDTGYDFIVAFPNGEGGTNFSAVEVKATERPIHDSYPLDAKWYKRLTHSNIPSLLMIVDAKQNLLYHAWPGQDDIKVNANIRKVRVPVLPIDDAVKEQIRERLASGDRPGFNSRGPYTMSTPKHYFVEQTDDGRYAVRAKGSQRASDILDTERAAIDRVHELNPNDHPDVERVRNTSGGHPDKWRSKG